MTKVATPYAEALEIAQELIFRIRPACARIEIAGSLRRLKPEVGDIELVAIPLYEQNTDLFGHAVGAPVNLIDEALGQISGRGPFAKNGPAFKQFDFLGQSVDLFLVNADTWGVQFLIRTGNREFSHWMVTPRTLGGALPFGMQVRDGRLWQKGAPLATPEEIDVFLAAGVPYRAPAARSAQGWFHQPW